MNSAEVSAEAVRQAAALAAPVYVQPKVEVEVEMPVVEVPVEMEMIEEHQQQVDPIAIIDTTYHPPFEEEVVIISRYITIFLVDEKAKLCGTVNEQAKP